ncbi:MAG: 3-deoxy-D-manno-octulosonate 8-phosphate phosphatase [Limnohabitans sp.]|nr:3-deoxy-D-manno-octulosonate 8-phosphate phosphatase [Limnohabitans sp.]
MTSHVLRFPPQLLDKARGTKIFFLDVDGVFTDGSLYYSDAGETLKKFNVLDGHGLKMLMHADIVPVVITGRDSGALRRRLSDLEIKQAYYGVQNKKSVAESCMQTLGFTWQQAAAMGDDWPDLPVVSRAALSFAPAQAHTELLSRVDHVCTNPAGQGAVREACDLLLMATGHYMPCLSEFLS